MVTVDLHASLLGDGLGDVDGGDGSESLAALAGGEGELELRFLSLAGEFLGFGDFLGFTLGTDGLEALGVAEIAFGCLRRPCLGAGGSCGRSRASL
jgi:hypothetical protein